MNVKELKEFLKDIDDDVLVVVFDESNTLEVTGTNSIYIDDNENEVVIVI